MKNLITLVLLLLLGSVLAAQDAFIDYYDGDVTVFRDGTEIPADFGMALQKNDRISTGTDGLAVIDLGGRGLLKIQPSTDLVLSDLSSSAAVELKRGAVFSRLDHLNGGSFDLRAGNATAGVRGTEFFTAYGKTVGDEPDVWLCVNEGLVRVDLDNGKGADVPQGEGINILSGDEMTAPQYFAWTDGLNWNMDPKSGDLLDTTDLGSLYNDPLDFDYD